MVRKEAARGGGRLPRGLRGVVWFGAVLWVIALSAPLNPVSAAEEPEAPEPPPPALCPPAGLEAEGAEQPAKEVRELRNDLREVCLALADRQDRDHGQGVELQAEVAQLHLDLVDVRERQAVANGHLEAIAESLATPLPVVVPAGLEVTNQPDTELVRQAVVDNTDTFNQNVWAVVGILVGFGLLGLIYKLVRP